MKFQRHDIVSALFPFSDLSDAKKRPVVIIRDLGDNVIACQITTKQQKYAISLQKNQTIGDIRFDSFICADLITTLHKSLIFKKTNDFSEGTWGVTFCIIIMNGNSKNFA